MKTKLTNAETTLSALLLYISYGTQILKGLQKINHNLIASIIYWLISFTQEVKAQKSFIKEIDLKDPHVNITSLRIGGVVVDYMPDINGDNIPELLLACPECTAKSITKTGIVYILWGNVSLPIQFNPYSKEWDSMDLGIRIGGAAYWDQFGFSLSSLPDINGDQKPELLVGAHFVDRNNNDHAGSTYLIWGNADLPKTIDLAEWDTLNIGIRFDGYNKQDWNGESVGYVPDLNGDNIPELLIGATGANYNGKSAGSVYIVWGNSTLPKIINLANWDKLKLGIRFHGSKTDQRFGSAVSAIPDINGDGLPEIMIGAYTSLFDATVYLLWGDKNLPNVVDLSQWETNPLGIRFDGVRGDGFARSLSAVNDINGDGLPELLISANGADPNGRKSAGSVFLIWGNASLPSIVKMSNWNNLSLGIRFDGPPEYNYLLGTSVTTITDLNGDNLPELLIGTSSASPKSREYAGITYLIWGNKNFPKIVDLANWDSLNIGLRLLGATRKEGIGRSLTSVPDISGDGLPEIFIGSSSGVTYLVLSESLAATDVSVTTIPALALSKSSFITAASQHAQMTTHTDFINKLFSNNQPPSQTFPLNNNITELTSTAIFNNTLQKMILSTLTIGASINGSSESSPSNIVVIVTVTMAVLSYIALLACVGCMYTRMRKRNEDNNNLESPSANQYDLLPVKSQPPTSGYANLNDRPLVNPRGHYLSGSKAKIEFKKLVKHNPDNQNNTDQVAIQALTTRSKDQASITGGSIPTSSRKISAAHANYDDIPCPENK